MSEPQQNQDEELREFESAANKEAIEREHAMEAAERTCLGLRIEIQQLTKERDAERVRADKAEAACAEMRLLVELIECKCDTASYGGYVCPRCKALSSDCGKGYQSNDQIGKRVQAAFPSFTQPSGGDDWIDELLGLLRVAHSQRDTAEKFAFGSVQPDCGPTLDKTIEINRTALDLLREWAAHGDCDCNIQADYVCDYCKVCKLVEPMEQDLTRLESLRKVKS
jgi:hypothetical protein